MIKCVGRWMILKSRYTGQLTIRRIICRRFCLDASVSFRHFVVRCAKTKLILMIRRLPKAQLWTQARLRQKARSLGVKWAPLLQLAKLRTFARATNQTTPPSSLGNRPLSRQLSKRRAQLELQAVSPSICSRTKIQSGVGAVLPCLKL